MIPATISCCYAFCLPVGTPCNAMVLSAGKIKTSFMVILYFKKQWFNDWLFEFVIFRWKPVCLWTFSHFLLPVWLRPVLAIWSSIGMFIPTGWTRHYPQRRPLMAFYRHWWLAPSITGFMIHQIFNCSQFITFFESNCRHDSCKYFCHYVLIAIYFLLKYIISKKSKCIEAGVKFVNGKGVWYGSIGFPTVLVTSLHMNQHISTTCVNYYWVIA